MRKEPAIIHINCDVVAAVLLFAFIAGCSVSNPEPPLLCDTPESLAFGLSDSSKTFRVDNCGGGRLEYRLVFDSEDWLVPPPDTSGTAPDTVEVKVNREDQTVGQHSANIRVESEYGNAVVAVTMEVGGAVLKTDPEAGRTLLFSLKNTRQVVTISNNGTGPLIYLVNLAANWLEASPPGILEGTLDTDQIATLTLDLDEDMGLKEADFSSGEVVISVQRGQQDPVRLYAVFSDKEDCPEHCWTDPTTTCPQCPEEEGKAHCDNNHYCRLPPVIDTVKGIDPLTDKKENYAEIGCDGESGWELVISGSHYSRPLSGQESGQGNEIHLGAKLAADVNVISAGEAHARVPEGLNVPEDGMEKEVAIQVTTYGVPSEAGSIKIRRPLPEIETIVPDVASVGENITLHGRNFMLCGSSNASVSFIGCEVSVSPDSLTDREMTVTIPECARTGQITLTVDEYTSRAPYPDLVVRDSIELELDLTRTPPFAAGLSLDGRYLAVLVRSTGFQLRLWDLKPDTMRELSCGNAEGNACLELPELSQTAAFSNNPLTGVFSVFVHTGGETFLRRIDFEPNVDYSNQAPVSPTELNCEGVAVCGAGSKPTAMLTTPDGSRLLMLFGEQVYEYSLNDERLRSLSDSEFRFRSLSIGPHGRYAYGVVVKEDRNPIAAVLDVSALDEEGNPLSSQRGQVVAELLTGFDDVRIALDPTGHRLFAVDPSGAGAFLVRSWNVQDPMNPAGEAPLGLTSGLDRLSAIAVDQSGQWLYGLVPGGEVKRTNLENENWETVSTVGGGSGVSLSLAKDNGRLLSRTVDEVTVLSVERPAPVIADIQPDILQPGGSIIVTLANDACKGRAAPRLSVNNTSPVDLEGSEDGRTYTGALSADILSGAVVFQCEGRQDSQQTYEIVGNNHAYSAFELGNAIDWILPIDRSDVHWMYLVNQSPGKVGLIRLNDKGHVEEDRELLDLGDTYAMVDAVTVDSDLYGLRRDQGGVFKASVPTWPNATFFTTSSMDLPNPSALAINQATSEIFITDASRNTIVRLNLETGDVVGMWNLNGCDRPTDILLQGSAVYVACEGNEKLSAWDATTGDFLHEGNVEFAPLEIAPGPNANRLLVSGEDRTALTLVNTNLGTFGQIEQAFVTGGRPTAITFDAGILIGTNQALFWFNRESTGTYRLIGRFPGSVKSLGKIDGTRPLVGRPTAQVDIGVF